MTEPKSCSCCQREDLPWSGRGATLDISGCRFSLYPMDSDFVSIILGAAFQALGVPLFSLILSVLRQAVIVLPVCLALVFIAPAQVWWCLPAAESISCAVALVLYRWVYHTKILPLGAAS